MIIADTLPSSSDTPGAPRSATPIVTRRCMPLRGPAIPSPTDCQLIDRPNPVALAPRRIILLQVYRFPRNRRRDSMRIAGARVGRFMSCGLVQFCFCPPARIARLPHRTALAAPPGKNSY